MEQRCKYATVHVANVQHGVYQAFKKTCGAFQLTILEGITEAMIDWCTTKEAELRAKRFDDVFDEEEGNDATR